MKIEPSDELNINEPEEKIAKSTRAYTKIYFDQVWFVITPLNPDKVNENLTDQNIRLEMTKKYCTIHKNFEVCDIEYKLPKPNYTADTLVELKKN
jgi:nicotinic acid mononucleotide adenylyltransferase